jgi:hypothetical protein
LTDNGSPASGLYDLQFAIFNSPTNGTSLGAVTNISTEVSGGLFTVMLNFGAAVFDGSERWLEIGAVTNGGGAFTTLSSRQPITSTPYALKAANATTVDMGAISNPSFIGTTSSNAPLDLFVNNQRGLRLDYPTVGTVPNLIGGYSGNSIGSGTEGAVIAGGGSTFSRNTIGADSNSSAIGGGQNNDIASNSTAATIAGGGNNSIGVDSVASAIGGGSANNIASNSTAATIAGGLNNDIGVNSGQSAIGGGNLNDVADNAEWAVIPGGFNNDVGADADYAFAAGRNAQANHRGSFVWADSTEADFASTVDNQFAVRAQAGARLVNSGDGATLLRLETDRPWEFRQLGSGAGTALELASLDSQGISNKDFIINTTGDVGIGITTPAFNLHVNGTAGKPGGGSWSNPSDARLKDVGRPFTRGLDDLDKIEPRHYHYSEDNALELPRDRKYVGLIAQDVRAAIPEAIEPNDTGYLHVNNDPILWTMLNGIKELNRKQEARGREAEVRSRILESKMQQKVTEIAKIRREHAELKQELRELKAIVSQLSGD